MLTTGKMSVCLAVSTVLILLCPVDVSSQECEPRAQDLRGRRCSKPCTSDRQCNGQKRCRCDGRCGLTCVNINRPCTPAPQHIRNGEVTVTPYNQFGAMATYTCDNGYSLRGFPRVCQGDGTWTGTVPWCELEHLSDQEEPMCPSPPVVQHASHDGRPGQSRYDLGINLRYTCDPGYTEHKHSIDRAWCVGAGTWVGPNITCTNTGCPLLPTKIENGVVEGLSQSQNMLGGTIRYTCSQGYFLVGEARRQCQTDGTWSGREPSCEQVVCGPPPYLENAAHDGSEDEFTFKTGHQLTYTCKFGFYPEGGGNRAICSGSEGKWRGPAMTCEARACSQPVPIPNGWPEEGYKFTYPARITYHCNEGFDLRGSPYLDCKANGQWDGKLPSCEPIHCPELSPPIHGTMIGSSTEYNTARTFICNNGYKVVGSEKRTCRSDGQWSGQVAQCGEINCGKPGPFYNGYLEGQRTTVGAVFFFRCNPRTKFNGSTFSTNCQENGQWSHPPPLCLGQCQIPSIENGTLTSHGVHSSWLDHGDQVNFRCLNGRVLNDSRPITCNNGTWTMIPKCVPAPCSSPPPQIANGHRVFFSLSHGSRARYFCMAGYQLTTPSRYMTCRLGTWHGARPKCAENYCPHPGHLNDGKILKVGSKGKFTFNHYIKTIKHGDRLTYECDRGYRLSGPKGAACVNGAWSPSASPTCVRQRHPVFYKLWRPREESKDEITHMYFR